MRWMFAINGFGFILAAVFAGYGLSQGIVLPWAMGAIVLFLAGFSVPFITEFLSFGSDFRRTGGEYLADARRPYQPSGTQEVFSGEGRATWKRSREPILTVAVLAVAACTLFALDVPRYLEHRKATDMDKTTITNF